MPPKNSGGSTKFPGGHKLIHRTAQTAFVRVVTRRKDGHGFEIAVMAWLHKTPVTTMGIRTCTRNSSELH